jgi:hypothetical protein
VKIVRATGALLHSRRAGPAATIVTAVRDAVVQFATPACPLRDDVTVVVIKAL